MKKSIYNKRFAAILLAVMLLLTSCLTPGTKSGTADTANSDAVTSDNSDTAQIRYYFANIVKMKQTVPETDGALVMLSGYYSANDSGGGLFYWDANATDEPNGGTVIAASDSETGRYMRVYDGMTVNVKWFGAVADGSTDDTDAIQAAIDSLPDDGGEVIMPGGTYRISKPIEIGNGTKDTPSTKNGIRLTGMGASFGSETTQLTWIRPKKDMEIMMKVNGPISDCTISGIMFYGDGIVDTFMYMTDMAGCTIENVQGKNFRKAAFIYTAATEEGSHDNFFKSVGTGNFVDESTGIYIGGDPEAGALVRDTVFTDCRFDTSQTNNSIATHITYAEKLTFMRSHLVLYNYDTCTGLLLDATVKDGYPRQNSFYDCSVTILKVSETEDNTIGYHFLLGHGTYDNEVYERHPHIFGITDIGSIIGVNGQ